MHKITVSITYNSPNSSPITNYSVVIYAILLTLYIFDNDIPKVRFVKLSMMQNSEKIGDTSEMEEGILQVCFFCT